MYNIAILDDEIQEAQQLREIVSRYFDRKELMERRIDLFTSGRELVNHVKAVSCDLLFLDIEGERMIKQNIISSTSTPLVTYILNPIYRIVNPFFKKIKMAISVSAFCYSLL